MAKFYQVGECGIDESVDVGTFDFCIYDYKYGSWDGNGIAVLGRFGEPNVYVRDLSHCSCYDPEEALDGSDSGAESLEAILGDTVHAGSEIPQSIVTKLRELVEAYNAAA